MRLYTLAGQILLFTFSYFFFLLFFLKKTVKIVLCRKFKFYILNI